MIKKQKNIQNDLMIFLMTALILITIGLLFIYSSSSIFALEKHSSSSFFVKKHLLGIVIGVCAGSVIQLIPLRGFYRLAPWGFVGSLALTTLTLVPHCATTMHGASRWLQIPGLLFQPSELLKITALLYVAFFIARHNNKQRSFIYHYLPLLMLVGYMVLILLKQPDFGLTVTLISTIFCILFIADIHTKKLFGLLTLALPAALYLIYTKPYRLQRILTFLNPWADPQGAGFQIIQSLIAVGSGSLWGVGIAHSKQKFFYLPMQHTDFIFSIIAEEVGFAGSLLLLTLYMLFLYFGIRIALQLTDSLSRFTVLGYTLFIGLQTVIHIAVATGLAPTKGVGLPFISYGNSALITNLVMIGIICNMVQNNTTRSLLYTC